MAAEGRAVQADLTVSLYLYEPHWAVRQAMISRLKAVPGLRLLGASGGVVQAAREIKALKPQVLVAALSPQKDLPQELAALCRDEQGPWLIALDVYWDERRQEKVEKDLGGRYLLKGLPWDSLVDAIWSVVQTLKTSGERAPRKYGFPTG
ncbi:MAG TPA: hypothetical protein VK008_00030 [Sphingobacteriaceae bacterium]|nr:hypothetical protein [Sphingobacteriaceae bacterium]